jgi:hypothetical protein
MFARRFDQWTNILLGCRNSRSREPEPIVWLLDIFSTLTSVFWALAQVLRKDKRSKEKSRVMA